MKNFLRKLHLGSNHSEDSEGSAKGSNKLSDISSPERNLLISKSHHGSEHNKPFSAISGWLNSVSSKHSTPTPPSSCSNVNKVDRMEPTDSVSSSGGLEAALEAVRLESESTNSRDPDIEEEYQIQMALELSAREDPEAVQIEAVKQISLGSCQPENTPAEVIAYRYWNYNALSFDDKILDGFYDLYGIVTGSTSSEMPPLVDLQRTHVSDHISWEAILVNRAADSNLLKLEQRALEIAVSSRSEQLNFSSGDLVQKLAVLVSDHMGGPVADPDNMLIASKDLCCKLKQTLGSMVLPLGSLIVGLARHRALLFKVLADSIGVPSRLVKGQQYTGSDDVAMNFVKMDDGREYIVDLMAAPGALIPSDTAGGQAGDYEDFHFSSTVSKDVDIPQTASSSSGITSSSEELNETEKGSRLRKSVIAGKESSSSGEFEKPLKKEPARTIHPYSHARSPSWTEGVSSPAAHRMKVKDVSQYMMDAAKENPHLAQKLHDVLLESGVVAPPNLFSEIYSDGLDVSVKSKGDVENKKRVNLHNKKGGDDLDRARFLPPLPHHCKNLKGNPRGLLGRNVDEVNEHAVSPRKKYTKNMPVAAAAAAAAAVVASSMVVAAAKTSSSDPNVDLPVAAAATATAAAVVATTAAVSKQYDKLDVSAHFPDSPACFNPLELARSGGDANVGELQGSGDRVREALGVNSEGERISDRSTENDSARSDAMLNDVAECEIPWEDIVIGERIGLGSYGEVYRGDWHGTEVAVKKFLDQDITGESLEEFKSEVWIMKRLRHPNVVLFMGAVTRPPNLSIVTEFLHRGSLYRLIHRPNTQLDERRRLRMALDTARGMNYLHNSTPMIVHRDLKSPNLLVDKNWVVKVCDFGLSRMKHSTFLSSRSTAGTAEWMAPEVLRNEPSDEKCDVYSFGVILWELCTLQQPWGGMNPMQVVGAVGFQHRRLDIPDDMDPAVADIVRKCWQTDPKLRPSFTEIMAALRPLQKPITSSYVPKAPPSRSQGKGKLLQLPEDSVSGRSR
ncbi:unnamed protein product [Cuscuta epithymum]|uniref:non-specific serine/threonine protein kinase n=1 Tax=Cuscuta epithymum TaxID=186058 RepID=A0AAV0G5P6_9ASTE|nr:unnamed protein product [Cuscuta epithymum]